MENVQDGLGKRYLCVRDTLCSPSNKQIRNSHSQGLDSAEKACDKGKGTIKIWKRGMRCRGQKTKTEHRRFGHITLQRSRRSIDSARPGASFLHKRLKEAVASWKCAPLNYLTRDRQGVSLRGCETDKSLYTIHNNSVVYRICRQFWGSEQFSEVQRETIFRGCASLEEADMNLFKD